MHGRWAGQCEDIAATGGYVLDGLSALLTSRILYNFCMPDTRRVWRWEQAVYTAVPTVMRHPAAQGVGGVPACL